MFKKYYFFSLICIIGCASMSVPPANNDYIEISITDFENIRRQVQRKDISRPKNGFIVNTEITHIGGGNITLNNNLEISLHGRTIDCQNNHNCIGSVIIYDDTDLRRHSEGITVNVYLSYFGDRLYLNKIEGLRTSEEVAEIQKQRDKEAETKRLANEEANRYDPENFIIIPRNFTPSIYKNVDLFDAVAEVEYFLSYGKQDNTTNFYVSDVIFVNQTGTSITFRTTDNVISQILNIESRSGLTIGQRVRLFYGVTFNLIPVWNVRAIERL